jgi:Caspase domain
MPTIHAILIGINEYPRSPLKGCINDVNNIKTTLNAFCNAKGYQFNEILLTNASATRQNIIDAYQKFQVAQAGDTCLVYFSGHGYRIAANPSVWVDGDSFHEAIYTFDADIPGGRGFVNKELAYLMWKNTQHLQNVHLVEIFDCCHAGGITRDIADGVAVRTIPSEITPLPQSEYLGVTEYFNNNGRLAAPVAHRIQLAASTGKETSKELKFQENGSWVNRGVFTTALCALLKEENFTTSYKDLLAKANIRVKNLIKDIRETHGDQSPQLDAERVEGETQVFTGKGMTASDSFIVGFSEADNVWQMQGGAIQSVAPNATIRIVETSETFQLMDVGQNTSKVLLSQKHDRNKQYHAEIIASLNNRIIAAFSPQVADNERNTFSNALEQHYANLGAMPRFFEKIEDTNYAQFLIHCENGEYYLTTKSDIHTPLFLRGEADGTFFESMEKVGKWFIVKGLENKTTRLKDTDVTIELSSYSEVDKYQRGVSQRWAKGNITEFHYDSINNTPSKPALGLSLKNNTGQALWVSIVWLSADFSITNKTLPTGKEQVAASNLVRISNGGNDKISIEIPKNLRNKGVLEVTEYLKVFVSTDELNTDTYNQSALEMDAARAKGMASNEPETEDPSNVVAPDWRTYNVEIRIKMPNTTSRLAGGMEGEIANHAIVAPEGFSADISAGAVLDGQRSIGVSIASEKLIEAELQPYFLSRGMATGASQSTLSFKNVSNPEAVSLENSIKLSLPNANNKEEMVLAMAYDAESGLYYPTGFQNENGQLEIHTLPEPTADGQRSLGGAVVMFLQKVALPITSIFGNAKTDDDFYKLRIAKIPNDLSQDTEYEADKSKIKVEIAKAKKIIIFIHGIIGDTTDQVKAIKRMNTKFDYDLVLAFDYESLDNPIQETAEKLKMQLASIGLSEGHGKELHFVVHSMGGLVSRWFIEQLGGDKIVTQLIMVGTPNNGSEISNVTSYVTMGVVAAVNFACSYFGAPEKLRAALSFGAKHGTTRMLYTLSQMNPKGDFIKQLNVRGADGTIPYHIIAGDIFAININLKDSGVFKKLMHNIENAAGKAIYGEPNDIAVRVDSIKTVMGVANDCKFEIPVDHTSYFADPKGVAQLEAVLIKINQGTPTVIPTPRQTEPVVIIPKTEKSLGFFARLIQWIKNLF